MHFMFLLRYFAFTTLCLVASCHVAFTVNAASVHAEQTLKVSVKQTPYQSRKSRFIVHLHPTDNLSNLSPTTRAFQNTLSLNTTSSLRVIKTLKSIHAVVVEASENERQWLQDNPHVRFVEADPLRYLQGQTTPYGISQLAGSQVSDSFVGNTPICIIDSGVDMTHEDLPDQTQITGEVVNRLTQVVDLGDWSTDSYGHGTHVTGIISALDNPIGVAGVLSSGQANIHHVKIIHNPNYWQIWGSDLIDALSACQQAGSKVVNMSIGGGEPSVAEAAAMQAAYDSGMLLVAAAGNRGNTQYIYPASYPSVIAVGAIDHARQAWQFTQRNDQIELVAAGFQVRSTIPNHLYRAWDGTSMSAPHVSAGAALVWSHFPQCDASRIREVLNRTATDLGIAGKDDRYGYGLLQVNHAISDLQANGCTDPAGPILTFHHQLASFDPQGTGVVYEDFEHFLPDVTPTMQTIKQGIRYVFVSHRPEDNGFVVMPSGKKQALQTELDMTSRTLTGNGEDDFIIYPPANTFAIGFDTFISRFGPLYIEVETVSGYKETYVHAHAVSEMGFVGVTSTEAITSVYFNGQTDKSINTGIDNLRLAP